MAKNPCKYWSDEEPANCIHWDNDHTVCTYIITGPTATSGTPGPQADLGPYCNLLGTAALNCRQYQASNEGQTQSICILPDNSRHVTNRALCKKWVHTTNSGSTGYDQGKPVYSYSGTNLTATGDYWSFEYINGYNDGACDGAGTDVTCSGYSPYNMAFGKVRPKPLGSEDINDLDNLVNCYTKDELGYRTPLPYLIYNLRAKLSRCYWWQGPILELSVDQNTGEVLFIDSETQKLKSEYNYCQATDTNVQPYWEYRYDANYGYITPCNGCKPECPHYTGVCWEFCIDDKMSEGDKILAEQILELRYYIRRERWADQVDTLDAVGQPNRQSLYHLVFDSPDIYAWDGTYNFNITPNVNNSTAIIHATRNYFINFDYFSVHYDSTVLTDGLATQEQAQTFPTLVKEISYPNLRPIIRNVFDTESYLEGDEVINFNTYNVFETGDLFHDDIVIWGDSFWLGSDIYTLNLSDPELQERLPSNVKNGLLEYISSYDLNQAKSAVSYGQWTDDLELVINNLLTFMPDKIHANELTADEAGFYINTKTYFGENHIIVLDNGSGSWEFDSIKVTKRFCGGVIAQTSFSIEGDGKALDRLPDFRSTLAADQNDNGEITFKFLPLSRTSNNYNSVAYVYNDTVDSRLGACYKTYSVTALENAVLDSAQVKFFGNSGKAVAIIPGNLDLSYVHGPFSFEGKVELVIVGKNDQVGYVEMEVYDWCNDALEVNQIVLRPKNLEDFFSPCAFELHIPKLTYKQKRSFGQTPPDDVSYEDISSTSLADSNTELSESEGTYSLRKFSDKTLMASVVYKGSNGRIKGLTRTKFLVWVRQPYCRDVEIHYSWLANYTQYDLYPRAVCYGKRYQVVTDTDIKYAYSPPCADHDKSRHSPNAPIWYPYDQCASYAQYSELSSAHSPVTNIMEVFDELDESGTSAHGNFDLRMLGPAESYGLEESHAHIWDCTCDFWYFNHKKTSNNMFYGNAYYRGGMDAVAYERCVYDGGAPPKFGNVVRDQLNSYRATDCVDYYVLQGDAWATKRKWMPAPQYFTISNITSSAFDYGRDLNTNDYTNPFVDQLGLLRFSIVDDVGIEETVDEDNRFRFEEVIDAHASTTLSYPTPYPYQVMGDLQDIIRTWYVYKDYPPSPGSAIQWLWREHWPTLDRLPSLRTDVLSLTEQDDSYTPPYDNGVGQHIFLDVSYPNYLRDYKDIEYRTVCEEGDHVITVVPSEAIDGSGTADTYFLVQLDIGPPRVLDIEGNWVTELPSEGVLFKEDTIRFPGYNTEDIKESLATYEACSSSSWNSNVTLYESGTITSDSEGILKEAAVDDGRHYYMYDLYGERYDQYYNRGLLVTADPNKMSFLPRRNSALTASDYEWQLSTPSEIPPYDSVEAGEFYPAQFLPNLMYDAVALTDVSLLLDFIPSDLDMYKARFITKVDIEYSVGEEVVDSGKDILYHIPSLQIMKRYIDGSEEVIHVSEAVTTSPGYGTKSVKTVTYVIDYTSEDLRRYYRYLNLDFGLVTAEDSEAPLDTHSHKVNIKTIKLYSTEFVRAVEPVSTKERRYYASYGNYVDIPIQGTNSTGNLLQPPFGEMSDPQHRDSITGILGAAGSAGQYTVIHKTASRFLEPCHPDKERVPGSDVYQFEAEQKKLFDNVMDKGNTTFTATSICPPGLKDTLDAIGLQFPVWSCTFTNTLNLHLADVIQQQPYNPCGHEWNAFVSVPKEAYGCYPSRTHVEDLFEYTYINPCTEDEFGSYNWIEAQYQAAVNRFEMGSWSDLFDALSGGLWEGTVYITTGGDSTVDESSLTSLRLP